MAMNLKQERELNKLLKENEGIQARIDKGIDVRSKTLEKQEENQKKINALLNINSTEYKDISKTLTAIGNISTN